MVGTLLNKLLHGVNVYEFFFICGYEDGKLFASFRCSESLSERLLAVAQKSTLSSGSWVFMACMIASRFCPKVLQKKKTHNFPFPDVLS